MGVFLRLVDDQQVITGAQGAGACPGPEFRDPAALHLDPFLAISFICRLWLDPDFRQAVAEALPGDVRCVRQMGRVKNVLAIEKPVERTLCQDLRLAVPAWDGIPELRVDPQAVFVNCHDIRQHKLLPFLAAVAGHIVDLYRFIAERSGIRQHHALGRNLIPDPAHSALLTSGPALTPFKGHHLLR